MTHSLMLHDKMTLSITKPNKITLSIKTNTITMHVKLSILTNSPIAFNIMTLNIMTFLLSLQFNYVLLSVSV